MENQHTENLFRRYKGKLVNIKTISGGVFEGRVGEITNDYVALGQRGKEELSDVFVFFRSIESMLVVDTPGA